MAVPLVFSLCRLLCATTLLLHLLTIGAIAADTDASSFPGPDYPAPWAAGATAAGSSGYHSGIAIDPSWAAAYARAIPFVANLTLLEKVNLTTGTGWESDVCVGNTGDLPRVGMRGLCLQDGPLGVRYADHNSAFPAGINVAATFSRRLMRLRGEALGAEFRGKGVDIMLGPVAGPLGRAPEGGRNWEAFGPDPYLAGVGMAETIQGIQSRGVIACAKHYILNEQEHFRSSVDVRIDDRTLHELYLWPFADAVRAGVGSVMCSYNKINGTHACENSWTSNYLLKNELAFQGFLMSDWNGQHTTLDSALAGLDMSMPGDNGPLPYRSWWGGALTEAVLKGNVPQWRLDDMVVRIMAAYFKVHTGNYTAQPDINFSSWTNKTTGYLHPSSNQSLAEVNKYVNVQADHDALIREIGAKSIVLLKNSNHLLPLRDPASIAIIGRDAQDMPGGPNACPERGCINGTVAMGYGSGTANFPYLISPATALYEHVASTNAKTIITNTTSNWDLPAAAAAARNAAVAIVFGTATAGEAIKTIDGNTGDRNNLTLWDNAPALIAAVAAVNPNTIVVLHTPGPVLLAEIAANPNVSAILWAGFPGQESGHSLVDVLYGKVNPQGRSPFTWGETRESYGTDVMYNATDPLNPVQVFSEGVLVDYRWFQRKGAWSVYPFGYGLSYTRFNYADLKIKKVGGVQGPYPVPVGGVTGPAPTFGVVEKGGSLDTYMAPAGFNRISPYIYPWLNSSQGYVATSPGNVSAFPVAARDGSPQPVLPSSGAPGGNPGLYEVLYTLTACITNEGNVSGTEIPQLYVQLGGEDNPFGVLRGFEEVEVEPGETKTVTFNLTRRDVSNWNTTTQNWQITDREKVVFVGSNTRDIHLNASLPAPEGMAWHIG